jgi:hypothetical protein
VTSRRPSIVKLPTVPRRIPYRHQSLAACFEGSLRTRFVVTLERAAAGRIRPVSAAIWTARIALPGKERIEIAVRQRPKASP